MTCYIMKQDEIGWVGHGWCKSDLGLITVESVQVHLKACGKVFGLDNSFISVHNPAVSLFACIPQTATEEDIDHPFQTVLEYTHIGQTQAQRWAWLYLCKVKSKVKNKNK